MRSAAAAAVPPSIARVEDLHLTYRMHDVEVHALRGASLEIGRGEAVALLGESGSGKSTLARALIGLLPEKGAHIDSGALYLDDQDVTGYREPEWQKVRGSKVAMVFQDPLTYLNPVMRIDRQLAEAINLQDRGDSVRRRVRELLDLVQLPSQTERSYAHELSGGMRQRALLAMALCRDPQLLIADEPTTALDVTTQAGILRLLDDIRAQAGMALLLVSHDLAILSGICSQVYVMYAGQTIEQGRTRAVFSHPTHPYTAGLLDAAEVLRDESGRFSTIDGYPPRLTRPIVGCAFAPRCGSAHGACEVMPDAFVNSQDPAHRTRCWLPFEQDGPTT